MADHSHFILTVDVAPHMQRPSRAIAQMLREAAAVVETQVVLNEHQHVYDLYGTQKYEWQMEDEAAPEPARRSLRVIKVVKRH